MNEPFLAPSDVVDFQHAEVAARARALRTEDALQTAERCFTWVRDEVAHSLDRPTELVTTSASEVLQHRTGLCFAKSHLLVALLRANGLRAGFAYQRLALSGPGPSHCLHGLVSVELPRFGWYRVDPRGNKPGLDARFEPPVERLAFAVTRPGERLFATVFSVPLPLVVAALRRPGRLSELLEALPDAEELDVPHGSVEQCLVSPQKPVQQSPCFEQLPFSPVQTFPDAQ